jgi:hypothetical protein
MGANEMTEKNHRGRLPEKHTHRELTRRCRRYVNDRSISAQNRNRAIFAHIKEE